MTSFSNETFINALPCHQHLGSCRGGIPLLVSGMPEKHIKTFVLANTTVQLSMLVCAIQHWHDSNTGERTLSAVGRNHTCVHDDTRRYSQHNSNGVQHGITSRSVSVVSYIPHLYNIS